MNLFEAQTLLERKDAYAHHSLAYTDAEELLGFTVLFDGAELILLAGEDMEAGCTQYHFAANDPSALARALNGRRGYLSFVPKDWVETLKAAGFTVRCVWCDYFCDELSVPEGLPPCALLKTDEYGAAAALTQACRNQSRGFTGQTEEWFRDWLSNQDAQNCAVLVERAADGSLCGLLCTGTYAHESEDGAIVWVRELAVLPAFRRQGIGRRLIYAAFAYGRAHGARRAFLAADENNLGAIALYRSVGFAPGASEREINMERL